MEANIDIEMSTETQGYSDMDNENDNSNLETESQQGISQGVTPEPRNKEEMHLDLIRNQPSMVETYLRVSDDNGDFHGDFDLEDQIKDFCELNISKLNENGLLEALVHGDELIADYSKVISKAEAFSSGAITKYRLRESMMLNLMKKIVKKIRKEPWEAYFNSHYPSSTRRTAQDYMKLARIPNIIRYACFAKARLLEIARAINDSDDSDPVGKFLADNGIHFDPDTDDSNDATDLSNRIDSAIGMVKIQKVEQKNDILFEVDESMIQNLVCMGKKVDDSLINKMGIIKKAGGNVNEYLNERVVNGGAENKIVETTIKLQSIPKFTADLRSIINHLTRDNALADQIKIEDVENLERKVAELKRLIPVS